MRLPIFLLRCVVIVACVMVLLICGGAVRIVTLEQDTASVYFLLSRVLLAGVCAASIPCLITLLHTNRLLTYIDTNRVFSDASLHSLKVIMRCAMGICAVCTLGGLPFFYTIAQIEDAPGLVLVGLVVAGTAFVVAVITSILTRLLHEAIDMKNENDLIV